MKTVCLEHVYESASSPTFEVSVMQDVWIEVPGTIGPKSYSEQS